MGALAHVQGPGRPPQERPEPVVPGPHDVLAKLVADSIAAPPRLHGVLRPLVAQYPLVPEERAVDHARIRAHGPEHRLDDVGLLLLAVVEPVPVPVGKRDHGVGRTAERLRGVVHVVGDSVLEKHHRPLVHGCDRYQVVPEDPVVPLPKVLDAQDRRGRLVGQGDPRADADDVQVQVGPQVARAGREEVVRVRRVVHVVRQQAVIHGAHAGDHRSQLLQEVVRPVVAARPRAKQGVGLGPQREHPHALLLREPGEVDRLLGVRPPEIRNELGVGRVARAPRPKLGVDLGAVGRPASLGVSGVSEEEPGQGALGNLRLLGFEREGQVDVDPVLPVLAEDLSQRFVGERGCVEIRRVLALDGAVHAVVDVQSHGDADPVDVRALQILDVARRQDRLGRVPSLLPFLHGGPGVGPVP